MDDSEIPEDIAAKAIDIMDAALLADMEGRDASEVIARALMAERERNAQTCEKFHVSAAGFGKSRRLWLSPVEEDGLHNGHAYAEAIRNGEGG